MIYEFGLTIPANTPRTAPTEDVIQLSPGRLVGASVQFPRGCVGLVHTSAVRGAHQIFPTNIDGDISGENAVIPWAEDMVLEDDPYELTLRGWNEDDTYPHTLTWRLNILPMANVRFEREKLALEDRLRRRALGDEA